MDDQLAQELEAVKKRVKEALDYADLILSDNQIAESEKKALVMVKQYLMGDLS